MPIKPLLVVSFALANAAGAWAAPINEVPYASLTGTEVVDFDDLPTAAQAGTPYDNTFVSRGVGFGERFDGQILSFDGLADVLSATANVPLINVAGTPNHNLDITSYNGSNVMAGLGPLGYPDFNAIGEGSFSALFSSDQAQFGFQLVGGNGGNAFINFFKRDGSLISSLTVTGLADAYYGFEREGGIKDIAGISIHNNDLGGIGFDNLKHDVVSVVPGIPEPMSWALVLAGLAVVAAMASRRNI